MSALLPETIVEGMFDALNARDYAKAAGAIAEHCEWHSVATEGVHRGPGAVVAGLREFVAAFPDWRRRGCSVAEVEGGKIVRYRDYYDRATLLQQLDLIDLL